MPARDCDEQQPERLQPVFKMGNRDHRIESSVV